MCLLAPKCSCCSFYRQKTQLWGKFDWGCPSAPVGQCQLARSRPARTSSFTPNPPLFMLFLYLGQILSSPSGPKNKGPIVRSESFWDKRFFKCPSLIRIFWATLKVNAR